MEGFSSFLKQHVGQRKVPFYLHWISSYNRFRKTVKNEDGIGNNDDSDRIGAFAAWLGHRYQDWQVQQAKEAVGFFLYYNRMHGKKSRTYSVRYEKRKTEALVPPVNNRGTCSVERKGLEEWATVDEKITKVLRLRNLSYRTEKTYLGWIRRFGSFVKHKSPEHVVEADIKDFLTQLVIDRRASVSTQNQAFNALLFFFRNYLNREITSLEGTIRSKIPRKLPVVLSRMEVDKLFSCLEGVCKLMAQIIYGGGLRLTECLMLRVKDVDYDRNCLTIRSGKGNKDRQTLFPEKLEEPILMHYNRIRKIYDRDRIDNANGVFLPGALERKYPGAGKEWGWFWVFPSHRLSIEPATAIVRRHHMYPTTLQKAFRKAIMQSGIAKHATVHSLRHSFATHLIEGGYDIRTIQELMGHSNVRTTMIYTHVATKNKLGVRSPLDSF